MQTHFKGTNYELTPEITAHASKKLRALRKPLGKGSHAANVYVDLGRETVAHQNGRVWYADVNLDCDGKRFYARALEETLEGAVDKAIAEVKRELLTYRKREQSLARRGGFLFKTFLQGFGR